MIACHFICCFFDRDRDGILSVASPTATDAATEPHPPRETKRHPEHKASHVLPHSIYKHLPSYTLRPNDHALPCPAERRAPPPTGTATITIKLNQRYDKTPTAKESTDSPAPTMMTATHALTLVLFRFSN